MKIELNGVYYVRLPGDRVLTKVTITELTDKVIVLKTMSPSESNIVAYQRGDVVFIEKIG